METQYCACLKAKDGVLAWPLSKFRGQPVPTPEALEAVFSGKSDEKIVSAIMQNCKIKELKAMSIIKSAKKAAKKQNPDFLDAHEVCIKMAYDFAVKSGFDVFKKQAKLYPYADGDKNAAKGRDEIIFDNFWVQKMAIL